MHCCETCVTGYLTYPSPRLSLEHCRKCVKYNALSLVAMSLLLAPLNRKILPWIQSNLSSGTAKTCSSASAATMPVSIVNASLLHIISPHCSSAVQCPSIGSTVTQAQLTVQLTLARNAQLSHPIINYRFAHCATRSYMEATCSYNTQHHYENFKMHPN